MISINNLSLWEKQRKQLDLFSNRKDHLENVQRQLNMFSNRKDPFENVQRQLDLFSNRKDHLENVQRQLNMFSNRKDSFENVQRQLDLFSNRKDPFENVQRQLNMFTNRKDSFENVQKQLNLMFGKIGSWELPNLNSVKNLDDETLIKVAIEVNQKEPEKFGEFLDNISSQFQVSNKAMNSTNSVRNVLSPDIIVFYIRFLIGCICVNASVNFDLSTTIWVVLANYILPELNKNKN